MVSSFRLPVSRKTASSQQPGTWNCLPTVNCQLLLIPIINYPFSIDLHYFLSAVLCVLPFDFPFRHPSQLCQRFFAEKVCAGR
jgi:hypothetical protein